MESDLNILDRLQGRGEPLIVAEIGANHNGSVDLCRRLVDAAVECQVDAVKFQSWTDRSLLSRKDRENGDFLEAVRKYQLTPETHVEIQAYCKSKSILFFSTPFSMEEADMLEEMDVPLFKVASMDINHLPFLRHVARKGRPMIVSTGMATLDEIDRAMGVIRAEGNKRVVLLHCVSLYPPDFNVVNLRNVRMLSDVFDVPTGFSDHTIGIGCSLAAIALGACVIEKHFTLDKNMDGWDHVVSADPAAMAMIVQEGRNIWRALGSYRRTLSEGEMEKAQFFRRSLVAKHAMKAGDIITEQDVNFKRPGTGIRPDEMPYVLGRKLIADIKEDDLLLWSHLQ
jgi:N-acetylneuraminate synthase